MENSRYINTDSYYPNSITKITKSAFKDDYCKELDDTNYCNINLPKFPSKKYSAGNFKYILNDIIHNRT